MEFFKKIGLKFKVFFGILISAIGFISILFIGGKLNARSKLNYELDKVRREINMENLEKDYADKADKISILKAKEKDIRGKIKEVEDREFNGEEVSVDEIDEFFKKRGLM